MRAAAFMGCRRSRSPTRTRWPGSSAPIPRRARSRGRCACGRLRRNEGLMGPPRARPYPRTAQAAEVDQCPAADSRSRRCDRGRLRRHRAAARPRRLGPALPADLAGPAPGREGLLRFAARRPDRMGRGDGALLHPPGRARGDRWEGAGRTAVAPLSAAVRPAGAGWPGGWASHRRQRRADDAPRPPPRLADVLTAIRTGCRVDDLGRAALANAEQRLRSEAEMRRLLRRHAEAVDRAGEIAARCRFSLDELRYEYPSEVAAGETPRPACPPRRRGAGWRYPDGAPDRVRADARPRTALIAKLGYAPYFLTVRDIVAFARAAASSARGAARRRIRWSATPRRHLRRPRDRHHGVRALRLRGPRRAARHRRRFRA
jgi:hypothetical protein